MSEFETAPATAAHAAQITELFVRAECSCYCRYWHFEGDKNGWQDRLVNAPEQSRTELLRDLETGSPRASGVVALARDDAHCIGWMKLTRAEAVSKLYDQRLYRGLPCFNGDRKSVYTVGCFLVDPEWRRRGVARALLERGIALATKLGATSVEAFPRRAEAVSDGERWLGPPEILLAAGFREVHAIGPYPVLRLELTDSRS